MLAISEDKAQKYPAGNITIAGIYKAHPRFDDKFLVTDSFQIDNFDAY